MVYRIYVTKQQPYAVEAAGVLSDVRSALQLRRCGRSGSTIVMTSRGSPARSSTR